MYDVDELRRIVDEPKAPVAKRAAANLWVAACEAGFDKLDRQPKSLAALREILDRLIGKPAQHVHITQERVPTLQEAERALADALSDLPPEQLAEAIATLPPAKQAELVALAGPKSVVNEAGADMNAITSRHGDSPVQDTGRKPMVYASEADVLAEQAMLKGPLKPAE